MAMVVRSNLAALNSNRQLGMNNSAVSKSLEKLSSGYRINRAGDDASGLSISEKMKAQIKGLEQASSNAQDGISLVQTAEGAMTEVHNMLNRMVELATKSANGTIANEVDREAIQSEVDQLLEEIDRIGDATNFNGINLLDGNLYGGEGFASITYTAGDDATPAKTVIDFTDKEAADVIGTSLKINGKTYQFVAAAADAREGTEAVEIAAADDAAAIAGKVLTALKKDTAFVESGADAGQYNVTNPANGPTIQIANYKNGADGKTMKVNTGALTLQVGDTNDDFNKVSVSVEDVRTKGLGINGLKVDNEESAGEAVKTVKDAINQVSTNRGNLGALQNRLEYAINNLDVTAENMTSANSRIRDTDMAKMMMDYTKMNVLTQSAQAMLAQANQQPQSILQLLQ